MKKRVSKFLKISFFKFIILILLYFLISQSLSSITVAKFFNAKTELTILEKMIKDLTSNNETIKSQAELFFKIYNPINKYGLYFCITGIIINILCFIVLKKKSNRFFSFLLAIIKLSTLSLISGFTLLKYSLSYNKEDDGLLETEYPLEKKPENNQDMNHSTKKYYHSVPRVMFSSILGFLISISISIIVFISLYKSTGNSNTLVTILGYLFAIIAFINSFILLIGYPNKQKCFKKCYKMARKGMEKEEVENIMRNYTPIKAGYTRDSDYVIHYKIEAAIGGEFEEVMFIFSNNRLYDIKTGYKRVTQVTYHY